MKTGFVYGVVSLLLAGLLGGCAAAEEPAAGEADPAGAAADLAPVWEAAEGLETPESAYLDTASGYLFVSLIAGEPDARDGNGGIAQLDRNGVILDADWVTGLNAPKGLRSHEGVLWTADIDEVVAVDIATGEIRSRTTVEGAQFLNDVAIGEDGAVYVSDTFASRIYVLSGGVVEVFAEGPELEYPNGLLVDGGRLVVGGWGEPGEDFSTEVPGRLYALDLETRAKTLITSEPFANLDGIESDGRGGWVVTDYLAGRVMHVASDGVVSDLATFGPGTADLAFIPGEGTAIVPHMQENRVAAYALGAQLP